VVSRIMPLAQAAEAHRLLHDRAVTGRIVLEI
jgi:NADPH:quinone reductase-like Zn-dependent oxidoreductase